MASGQPKHNYEQYDEELQAGSVPEIRLYAMLRQLKQDKKSFPADSYLHNTLGLVYQRLEKGVDALNAFKTSFNLYPRSIVAHNITSTMLVSKSYHDVMDFIMTYSDYFNDSYKMAAAILSNRYDDLDIKQLGKDQLDVFDAIEILDFRYEFSEIYQYLIERFTIPVYFVVMADVDEEGKPIIDIDLYMDLTIEEVVKAWQELSIDLVHRFSAGVLMHIIPNIQISEE